METVDIFVSGRLDDADRIYIRLPRHVCLSIQHNPHAGGYETAENWIANRSAEQSVGIEPQDLTEMLRTGEIWVISWCPNTPVGSCSVAAATLERAIELASGEASK